MSRYKDPFWYALSLYGVWMNVSILVGLHVSFADRCVVYFLWASVTALMPWPKKGVS